MFYFLPTQFNIEKWKSDLDHRYEMANSLIYGGHLKSKNMNDVQTILGIPESVRSDTIWSYNIGTRPGQIDPDFLEIYFTKNIVFKVSQICEGKGSCKENKF